MNSKKLSLYALSLVTIAICSAQSVDPMVKATFNQDEPFDNLCPHSAVAGCGPVAIAEILSYYKQPAHGYGIVTYVNTEYDDTIKENLDDYNFDWDNILDSYSFGNYTNIEAMSVAKLVYACGVASNVAYGFSSSINNKHRMVYNLQHHLHISPESRYLNREYYSTPEWIEMLNSQLVNGHPVFYRGTTHYNNINVGHMFVIDGIDDSGLYHANWGHGGEGNKFTNIEVLNQGAEDGLPGGKNVCYNFNQAMMINFYPVEDISDLPMQWCTMSAPITINDDETTNQIEVKLDQSFKLGTRIANCANDTCDVEYKWVLTYDGEEVMNLASGHWSEFTPFYSGIIEKSIAIPSSVPNGVYKAIIKTKSSIVPKWQPVRDNPINNVDIYINNGLATVSVPDQRKGDPELYLADDVSLTYGDNNIGLEIVCDLINDTDNNYDGKFKIEVTAENSSFECEPEVSIYNHSNVKYRFVITKSEIDAVNAVKIWYLYNGQEIELTTTRPSNVSDIRIDEFETITIYTLQGQVVAVIRYGEIEKSYNRVLSMLPKGVYIMKDGKKTRKFIK